MKRRGPGDCRWAAAVALFCCLIIEVLGTCGPPTSFRFAELKSQFTEMNIFPVGTIVSYNCRPGYIPIPEKSSSITCLQNLTWSIVEPFCERKSCGSPGELINGGVDLEDNLFGSTATFFCNPGYRLVGRNKRLCLYTGSWSNVVPICEGDCGIPPLIDSAKLKDEFAGKTTFSVGSVASYVCDQGYGKKPGMSDTITCQDDSTWSEIPEFCEPLSCADPVVQNGRKISGFGHSYKYGQSVEFECDHGFTLVGSGSITCGEDSEWHPPVPTCQIPAVKENTGDYRKIPGGVTTLCEFVDQKTKEPFEEAEIENYKTIMEMKKECLEIQKLELEIRKLRLEIQKQNL